MPSSTTAASAEGHRADWLALRRDADARARTESTEALLRAIALPGSQKRLSPLDIVDLGSGSGNNALYLMPNLASAGIHHQRWVLVDQSGDLLDRAATELAEEAERVGDAIDATLDIEVVTCCLDLATHMDDVPIKGCQLITSSSLIGQVSGHWVTDLSSRLEHFRVGAAFMTMISDGHVDWSPKEPRHDAEVLAAYHTELRRDRGFGPALGPDAITTFGRAMVARGTTVQCFDASWILDDLDTELQECYLDRMTQILRATDLDSALLDEWYERRRRWIDSDESELVVGHYDVLALRAIV